MTHAATSKVENSAQGSSCKLKFVHGVLVGTAQYVYATLAAFFRVENSAQVLSCQLKFVHDETFLCLGKLVLIIKPKCDETV
jgi:hypothetical protein